MTNENRANVAVQITMLIPAMISRAGTIAFGPPAKTRTGNEVRTMTALRRADLRTMPAGLEPEPRPHCLGRSLASVLGSFVGPNDVP